MAIRVDREGLMDALGGGSSEAGGAHVYDDGERQPPWQPRPFSSRAEYTVTEGMRLMAIPAEEIAKIRPPVPYDPNPPIFGYDNTALTISEVLDTNRWAPTQRSFMSGSVKPRQADAQEDMWSGTPRNFGGGQGAM